MGVCKGNRRTAWIICNLARRYLVFTRCIELFAEYHRVADAKKIEGFSAPLGCEVTERLHQMTWLLGQIRPREDELNTISARAGSRLKEHVEHVKAAGLSYEDTPMPPEAQMSRENGYRSIALMFEIKLHVECFYYFAARARSIIRGMPQVKSFEATGVRNVRNHLIEHPEGRASQVLSRSFGFGGANGPVVKAIRESTETAHPDAGLFAKPREFADNLEKTLENAVRALA